MMSLKTRTVGAVIFAAALLGVTACSGGNGTSTGPDEPVSTGEVDASFLEAIDLAIAEGTADDAGAPPTTGPAAQAGKNVHLIACAFGAEGCKRPADGAVEAAEAIGWDYTLVDTQGDPTKAAAAIRQAISTGADAIWLNGFDGTTLAAPLAEARAAGIPLASSFAIDPTGEFDAAVADDTEADGYLMGQQLYKLTDGKVHLVMFTGDEFGVDTLRRAGTERFIQDCQDAGGDCKVLKKQNVMSTDLATTVPSTAVSVMTSNPGATAMWVGYDAMGPFVTQGLAQAQITDIPLVGFDGNTQNIQMIRDGEFQVASMAAPMEWAGWQSIDNLNRMLSGEEPLPLPAKIKLITADNAPASGGYDGDYANWRDSYKEVWGR